MLLCAIVFFICGCEFDTSVTYNAKNELLGTWVRHDSIMVRHIFLDNGSYQRIEESGTKYPDLLIIRRDFAYWYLSSDTLVLNFGKKRLITTPIFDTISGKWETTEETSQRDDDPEFWQYSFVGTDSLRLSFFDDDEPEIVLVRQCD